MKYLAIALASLALAGCSSIQDRIVTQPVIIERAAPIFPEVLPVQQYNFEWIVVTNENFIEKMAELEQTNKQIVLFATTPEGYQNLSLSVAELRRYIEQQQAIIAAYKEYTAPKEEPTPPPAEPEIPFWKFW